MQAALCLSLLFTHKTLADNFDPYKECKNFEETKRYCIKKDYDKGVPGIKAFPLKVLQIVQVDVSRYF